MKLLITTIIATLVTSMGMAELKPAPISSEKLNDLFKAKKQVSPLNESNKPTTTHYSWSPEITKGWNLIAGSADILSNSRGKKVVFKTYDGTPVPYRSFGNTELEKELIEKIEKSGAQPVILTAHFTEEHATTSNSSLSVKVYNQVHSCEIVSGESICLDAEKAGFTAEQSASFLKRFN